MNTSSVRNLHLQVRTMAHRINDLGMGIATTVEGGEAYWQGFLASAAMILTRLDAELERELEERKS